MNAPAPDRWRVDFARTARLAWAHRMWIFAVNAIVVAAAIVTVLLLPRWYVSSVTLVPAPKEGITLDGALPGLGLASIAAGVQTTPQDGLRMVAASRTVADSIVAAFDLQRRWNVGRRDEARRRLATRTRFVTPKDGRVVVEVEARSATEARDIAAAYARLTRLESVRMRTSLAGQRRAFLEERLAEVDRELAVAADSVLAFEQAHGTVSFGDQARATVEAVERLRAQLALIQTEFAAARRYFADGSSELQMLSDRATELRRQIATLEGEGESMLPGGAALPALKQEYFRLTREQASVLAVGELLRRVYEEARVEESNPVPAFSVLDEADLPERPARPPRLLTVTLVSMLGAAASLFALEWRERTHPRLSRAPLSSGRATLPSEEDPGGRKRAA